MARNETTSGTQKPVVIKKYANRRLYNTATSSYVTLDHLCQMVKDDVDFAVYDAKTGEDITRSVLTQIIVEEESKGTNLLPITFLRQLISFYGHSMQGVVPNYLEHMMGAFAQNQDRLRQQMQETMSGMFPFGSNLEHMSRQNAAFMENAMKMFNPFTGAPASSSDQSSGETGESANSHAPDTSGTSETVADQSVEALYQLQRQMNQLQQQLNALSTPPAEQTASDDSTSPKDDEDSSSQKSASGSK